MGKIINKIKMHIPDRVWQLLRIIIKPKRPQKRIKIEVHVTDHCNLNCRGCDNFSCLAEPKFLNIESFAKDLRRLKEVFDNNIAMISLIGGEPLLNNKISDYCYLVRSIFPNTEIRIITNGTLLLEKDDLFWEQMRENRVLLYVTKYPISFDYEAARRKASLKGVPFQYAFESGDVLKTMYKTPIDLEGKQNPWLSFKLCGKGNKCITLREGRLYTCEFLANIGTFNKCFGTNIEVTNKDYVDIYCENNKEVIKKRMATFVPACRYCDNLHYSSGIPWGVTSKSIYEWVDIP